MTTRTIRLSEIDISYLESAQFLPDSLLMPISEAKLIHGGGRLLEIDSVTAELFRDAFTRRLAEVGFGPGYELTQEGALLEGLLDRFFLIK